MVPEILFCAMDLIYTSGLDRFCSRFNGFSDKSEQKSVMHFVGIVVVQSESCLPVLTILLTHKNLNVFCFLLTFAVHQNS